MIKKLERDTGDLNKIKFMPFYTTGKTRYVAATENNRTYAGQLGGHFYIWWPYNNLILARHFNGVYWDIYAFH